MVKSGARQSQEILNRAKGVPHPFSYNHINQMRGMLTKAQTLQVVGSTAITATTRLLITFYSHVLIGVADAGKTGTSTIDPSKLMKYRLTTNLCETEARFIVLGP